MTYNLEKEGLRIEVNCRITIITKFELLKSTYNLRWFGLPHII